MAIRGGARRQVAALGLALLASVSLAGALSPPTWTERGPALGGRLDGIVASARDPNVLIVASPGGGVWRTAQGVSRTRSQPGHARPPVLGVSVAAQGC